MQDYRAKLITPRRIVCTGNPDNPYTIASAVRKRFPTATFIHRSNGFDLTNLDQTTREKLISLFKTHNTFINASFIAPYVQNTLLTLCKESTKICDVFNVGSTHEYDGGGSELYSQSKLDLRNKSLEYNSYRFKTCHIIVGGIKNSADPERTTWIDVDEICNIVDWVMNQRFGVPIISLDQPKQPW